MDQDYGCTSLLLLSELGYPERAQARECTATAPSPEFAPSSQLRVRLRTLPRSNE